MLMEIDSCVREMLYKMKIFSLKAQTGGGGNNENR